MLEIYFETVLVRIMRGDLTQIIAEALVNPANSYGLMGGGVSLALKSAGGPEIERAAVARAPIPIGSCVETTAGKLKASYIFHAPTMENPGRTTPQVVRAAVKAALNLAASKGVSSIAFPAMGTGVGGIALDQAAEIMAEEITAFAKKPSSVTFITLVASRDDMEKAFVKAFERPQ